jgi:hypothetical protein
MEPVKLALLDVPKGALQAIHREHGACHLWHLWNLRRPNQHAISFSNCDNVTVAKRNLLPASDMINKIRT